MRFIVLFLITLYPGVATAAAPAYELRLSLYAFSQSRWQADEIEAAVRDAGTILRQCGIEVQGAAVRVLQEPTSFVFTTPAARDLLKGFQPAKPAVFFVEDTANKPAFEAEAVGRANATTRPEMADTVWVTYGAKDLPIVLAHELVHVLSDSGEHSDEAGNLMSEETAPDRTRLTPKQCARARAVGQVNGLLKRGPAGR